MSSGDWTITWRDPQPAQEALRQMLDEAYERGRRDALRGGAGILYFEAGLFEQLANSSGRHVDLTISTVLAEFAEDFAEEAAR